MQLIRGQKLKLSDILYNQQAFSLQIISPTGIALDIAIFGLDNQAKLSNEDYMIFYNQATKSLPKACLPKMTQAKLSLMLTLRHYRQTLNVWCLPLLLMAIKSCRNCQQHRLS